MICIAGVHELIDYLVSEKQHSYTSQHAMKVMSNCPGLVDFAIGLLNSVLNLPNWLVKVLGEFELQKNCSQFCSSKIFTPFHNCTSAKWVLNNVDVHGLR